MLWDQDFQSVVMRNDLKAEVLYYVWLVRALVKRERSAIVQRGIVIVLGVIGRFCCDVCLHLWRLFVYPISDSLEEVLSFLAHELLHLLDELGPLVFIFPSS